MKKAIYIFIIAVLLICAISVTAFAHGMGNRAQQQAGGGQACFSYEICSIEGCTELGIHEHDGVYYRCANGGMMSGGRGRCCNW